MIKTRVPQIVVSMDNVDLCPNNAIIQTHVHPRPATLPLDDVFLTMWFVMMKIYVLWIDVEHIREYPLVKYPQHHVIPTIHVFPKYVIEREDVLMHHWIAMMETNVLETSVVLLDSAHVANMLGGLAMIIMHVLKTPVPLMLDACLPPLFALTIMCVQTIPVILVMVVYSVK